VHGEVFRAEFRKVLLGMKMNAPYSVLAFES
jgi:hypothetical protein